jgi:hypothetical protein
MEYAKKNLYKQPHVFRCVHDVHRRFQSELSPFYILNQKKCFPDGCVYFQWKCRLLAKHKMCFRGFSQVGKKCFNCRYFYEEKEHQYPELMENGWDRSSFLEAFEEFEEWVQELKAKRVPCEGTVAAVIPELSLKHQGGKQQLLAYGFLIRFNEGFINNCLFEDPFYLSISSQTQNQLLIRKDDVIEFEANLNIDRGRFKFNRSGKFQFYQRGEEKALRSTDVLAALRTYTIQENQPEKCLRCQHGILVDRESATPGPSRATICLQGIADYRYCAVNVNTENPNGHESCINAQWGNKKCYHVL